MSDKIRIKDMTELQSLQSGNYFVVDTESETKKISFDNIIDTSLSVPNAFADSKAVGDSLAEKMPMVTIPDSDGTYILKAVKSGETVTYSWVSE